jgi:transposase-like protein
MVHTMKSEEIAAAKRRHHERSFKANLILQSLVPGASVSAIAMAAGINANLLQWKGIEATETLAKSPNAHSTPRLPTWNEYANDMKNAVGRIWSAKASTDQALHDVQEHQQQILDHRRQRWDRLAAKLTKEWSEQ